MNTRSARRCQVCGSGEFEVFVEIPRVPAYVGVVWPSEEEARGCPRANIALAFCCRCGFIGNVDFEPDLVDYTPRYDNALHFSPLFLEYEKHLTERLVDVYHVRGKDIIEIGCGSGRFLGLLCRRGGNRGTGFDPSHDPDRADHAGGEQVTVIRDYYSERYARSRGDLVCCRHVLEHIADPRGFLRLVRGALSARPDALLYFEVPNALSIFRDLSVWDVIYEHYGYFAPGCLEYLFQAAGFEILDLRETYGGQFLGIEATPSNVAAERKPERPMDISQLEGDVGKFRHNLRRKSEEWQRRLASFSDLGARVVVWGGGAKAVSFLNSLDIDDRIAAVVDINPAKQGCHVAGSGHRLVAPEFLREHRPDAVIVMNPIYRPEVETQLTELGLCPAVLTV